MDVTSKGLGSIVGGVIFMSNDQNIVIMIVAATAILVGTAVVVSSLFRFVARHAYKK